MAKKLFHFDGNYDFLSRSAITKKFVFVCSAHIIFNIGIYDLEIAFLGTGWNLQTRVNFFCSFSTLAEIPLEGISHHTNLKKRFNFLAAYKLQLYNHNDPDLQNAEAYQTKFYRTKLIFNRLCINTFDIITNAVKCGQPELN